MRKNNVYIAGLPRGGTTLVSQILGQHSQIIQMGESMYTGVLNPANHRCSCGQIGCLIQNRIFKMASINPSIKLINTVYGIFDRMREPDKITHKMTIRASDSEIVMTSDLPSLLEKCCTGFDCLTEIFASVYGNHVFVDNTKEIAFAEHLCLRKGWRIILITRDPRGMAWSTRKAGLRKNVPRSVESKINTYLDFAQRAIQLRNNKSVLFFRYEDLCNYTDEIIMEMCNFLGLEFERQLVLPTQDRGHTLAGNRMRMTDQQEIIEDLSWMDNLSIFELDVICKNQRLRALYKELGYDLH